MVKKQENITQGAKMDWDAYLEDICGSDTEEEQSDDLFEVNSLIISFIRSEDTENALNR